MLAYDWEPPRPVTGLRYFKRRFFQPRWSAAVEIETVASHFGVTSEIHWRGRAAILCLTGFEAQVNACIEAIPTVLRLKLRSSPWAL